MPRVSASHLACVTETHLAWIKMYLACVSEIVIISGADFHSSRESIVRRADSSARPSVSPPGRGGHLHSSVLIVCGANGSARA
ncbi:hypothetical protein ACLB2K_072246 [Fragaria x ananassa]